MSDGLRARIRAGDREAFAELYESYARMVYNHAFRLTGDWSVAEEVMGDTFLDAWRTREQLEPGDGTLKPWLLGVARRRLASLPTDPDALLEELYRMAEPDEDVEKAQAVFNRIGSFLGETVMPPKNAAALYEVGGGHRVGLRPGQPDPAR